MTGQSAVNYTYDNVNGQNTKADEKYLLMLLVNSTIEDVATKEGYGYKAASSSVGALDK
jgi:hypothetical protein